MSASQNVIWALSTLQLEWRQPLSSTPPPWGHRTNKEDGKLTRLNLSAGALWAPPHERWASACAQVPVSCVKLTEDASWESQNSRRQGSRLLLHSPSELNTWLSRNHSLRFLMEVTEGGHSLIQVSNVENFSTFSDQATSQTRTPWGMVRDLNI